MHLAIAKQLNQPQEFNLELQLGITTDSKLGLQTQKPKSKLSQEHQLLTNRQQISKAQTRN